MNLFSLLVLFVSLSVCQTQDEPGEPITGEIQRGGGGGGRKKLLKGTAKRVPKKLRPGKGEVDSTITQALAIHYPLSFFDSKLDPKDWYVSFLEFSENGWHI